MSTSRERQLRLEKKRRRRARRVKTVASTPVRSVEASWSQVAVLAPAGRVPGREQLAAFEALGTMSDALLELMEPYVWWPPAPDELSELEVWLRLGAEVWNATVQAHTGLQLKQKLRVLADRAEIPGDEEPAGLLEEIATRKLELFREDCRLVGVVTVRAEGRNAAIEATSLAYLR